MTCLGGIWGKSRLEDKFEKFERAIYGTTQRPDETHESYLARHDHQFEDLIGMKVGMEEFRAYILLRNSALSAEDKKRLIVEPQGSLEYHGVVANLKLLGSRFFHEVHAGKQHNPRTKTYDTTALLTEEEPTLLTAPQYPIDDEFGFVGDCMDDNIVEQMAEDGDPDAVVCMQFEEGLMETLQNDADMASCLNAYTEARKRLADKTKGRGFWTPVKKGFGKDRKGKSNRFDFRSRKPLAQRILESNCRRCGAKGHWKAECPLRHQGPSGSNASKEGGAFTGVVIHEPAVEHDPEDDMIPVEVSKNHHAECFVVAHATSKHLLGSNGVEPKPVNIEFHSCALRLLPTMKVKLGLNLRPLTESEPVQTRMDEVAHFVSHGSLGIVDLGASQTVIGQHQVNEVLQQLPKSTKVLEVPCQTVFRFGNSSTVQCDRALLVPLGAFYVKICIVPSKTPFLLSNNLFRKLEASIHTATDEIHFGKLGVRLPLQLSEKKLYLLDFAELVRSASQSESGNLDTSIESKSRLGKIEPESVLISLEHDSTVQSKRIRSNSCPRPQVTDRDLRSHVEQQECRQDQGKQQSSRAVQPFVEHQRDGASRSREHEHRRTGQPANLIRRGQERSDLPGGSPERSTLCGMVPRSISGQSQTGPQELRDLHQKVCGRGRAEPRTHILSRPRPRQLIAVRPLQRNWKCGKTRVAGIWSKKTFEIQRSPIRHNASIASKPHCSRSSRS